MPDHIAVLQKMLDFAENQVRHCEISRAFNEERVTRSNPYDARHYQREADRNTRRAASFQPDIDTLRHCITMLEEKPTVNPEDTRITRLVRACANLRYAYRSLRTGSVINQPMMANGLLGPAIVSIEMSIANLTTK